MVPRQQCRSGQHRPNVDTGVRRRANSGPTNTAACVIQHDYTTSWVNSLIINIGHITCAMEQYDHFKYTCISAKKSYHELSLKIKSLAPGFKDYNY